MAGKDEPENTLCKNPKRNKCNLKLLKHASDQTERSEPYRIGSLETSDEIYWQIVTVWWDGQYCSNLIKWPAAYQYDWPCLRNLRLFLGCRNWISCFSPKVMIDWPCRHSTVAAAEWSPALSKLWSAQFKSLPPSPSFLLFSTLDKQFVQCHSFGAPCSLTIRNHRWHQNPKKSSLCKKWKLFSSRHRQLWGRVPEG